MLLRKMFILTAMAVALTFLFCLYSYGEGSIGLSYSQVVDDISYGLVADHEHDFELGELESSAQIQAGDKYFADANIAFTFDLWDIGFRPYIDVTGKADTIESIGGKLDYGLTFNVPVHETTEAGIGVFLRNANPFAEKTLYEYVDNEYKAINSNAGINYDNPAKVNVLAYTGFEVSRFEVGLKGSIGLGQRDYWLIVDVNTGFDLRYVELNVGMNLGNRWYNNENDEKENKADIAIISSVTKKW